MKKSRFTEEQMVMILREADQRSVPVLTHDASFAKGWGLMIYDKVSSQRYALAYGHSAAGRCGVG